ncbi:MAG: hypothetical protein PF487_09065 [Bacteroidales bacterium]|jgi:hypothetical protein|nr:hypothetical protein [Bacteroidales bacterium]
MVEIPDFIPIPDIPDSFEGSQDIKYSLENNSEKYFSLQNFLIEIDWDVEDIYTDISYLLNDLNNYCETKETIKQRIIKMLEF